MMIMKKNMILITLTLFLIFLFVNCKIDHGLGPIDESTGITGTITFTGSWLEPTDILNFPGVGYLFAPAALKNSVPLDEMNLFYIIALYDTAGDNFSPFNLDTLYPAVGCENCTVKVDYTIAPLEPGEYNWIFFLAVPQSPDFANLGKYVMASYYAYGDSSEYGQVVVEPERLTKNIDMTVDLDSLAAIIENQEKAVSY
ncbi:hypothetical protein JW877_07030 [bacterium]|nr:hypothetical protein [bacterium]